MTKRYIPKSVRQRVRVAFGNRCAYCQAQQDNLYDTMEVEHIIPQASGGTSSEDNLCLCCSTCNSHKGTRSKAEDPETGKVVPLFNPRTQVWSEHFCWSDDGTLILGLTEHGRATIATLQLNRPRAVRIRADWVKAGKHPQTIKEKGG